MFQQKKNKILKSGLYRGKLLDLVVPIDLMAKHEIS